MTTKALGGTFAVILGLVAVVCLGGAALFSGATASACSVPTPTGAPSTEIPTERRQPVGLPSSDPGCVRAIEVLARAATWLTAWDGGPVPYLSSDDTATWFNGYRRDCSGYASMALGLPGPGLDTAALAASSTPIGKGDLLPGDLLINPAPDRAGHVVIFDSWTDATMTSYLAYEQSGDGGTHHRVIPYPYFGGYPMSPYRPAN
jgi:hypothetical protein